MKKVLLISYYWPPAGGIVIRRAMTLAKYLPRHGFEPIVLCAGGETPWMNLDTTAEIPDVQVHRVDAGDLNLLFSPEKTPLGVKLKTALRALFRTDYMANWAVRALTEAEKIIARENIEIVIITSPPFSLQGIGTALKKEFPNIKYVADLRDLFYSFRRGNPLFALRKMLAIPRAKGHLRNADLIVKIWPEFEDSLVESGIDAETVLLGFDCEIAEDGDYVPGEEFRIIHTGSFPSTGQTAEFVLVAFDMACNRSPLFAEKARLIFAGASPGYIANKTPRFAERPDNIIALGHIPHSKALELQRGADVNLLISTIPKQLGGEVVITGKFYEYVASRRPILATCHKNNVAVDLIRQHNLGVVCPNIPDSIELELLNLFSMWCSGNLPEGASKETAEKFSSAKMVERYAEILEEL